MAPRNAAAFPWFRRPSTWLAAGAWLTATATLAGFGRAWPAALQLAGWGLLLAALLGLLGISRLVGPVLFYDLVAMGRRPRFVLVRGLYALVPPDRPTPFANLPRPGRK